MADQYEQNQDQGHGGQTAQISGTVHIQQQGETPGRRDKKEEPKPEESPEKKSRRLFIIIGVVVLLAIIALFFFWRSSYTEDTDDAQVDGSLYQVSSRVAGQVVNVNVEEQQLVHKGDPIAEIDPRDYQVSLEQAEANLISAQADFENARVNVPITSTSVSTTLQTSGSDVLSAQAQVEQAEAQTQAARARVDSARANAIKAQLDVDRYTPLVAKDVISKQQYDGAVAQAAAYNASLDEAQRSVKAQQDTVRMMQQRLAQSRSQAAENRKNGPEQVKQQQARADAAAASVKQAQARVDQARLNMGYTHVKAPITGLVSKKSVVNGSNLSVGQSLMTIVPLEDLWVTANFKETQLDRMHARQAVEIKVDALGGKKFHGHITQIGGATGSSLSLFPPENATGNYVKVVQRIPVRIDFDNLQEENKEDLLRIGMSVVPVVRVK